MKNTSRILSILLALLMVFSISVTALAAGGNGGGNGGSGSSQLTLVSATIGDTPLAEATEIRSNAEILLTFSENVTDDSVLAFNIAKVNVKDSGNQNVSSVTVAKSGTKKLTVSLNGVEKAAYTLTIGKEFKDVNGNTLGTKVEIPFTVNKGDGSGSGGGSNPLNFVSAKANGNDLEGAVLPASGKITITFDRGMTEHQDDNFAQIGIYNADGQKAADVEFADFTKDDDGNSYTVLSYSGLSDGAYTLKLGKDLKANNGNTLGKAVTISFTVKGDEGGNTNAFMKILKTILNFFKQIIEFFKSFFK